MSVYDFVLIYLVKIIHWISENCVLLAVLEERSNFSKASRSHPLWTINCLYNPSNSCSSQTFLPSESPMSYVRYSTSSILLMQCVLEDRRGKDRKGQSPLHTHINTHLRCVVTLQTDQFCFQQTFLTPQLPTSCLTARFLSSPVISPKTIFDFKEPVSAQVLFYLCRNSYETLNNAMIICSVSTKPEILAKLERHKMFTLHLAGVLVAARPWQGL